MGEEYSVQELAEAMRRHTMHTATMRGLDAMQSARSRTNSYVEQGVVKHEMEVYYNATYEVKRLEAKYGLDNMLKASIQC